MFSANKEINLPSISVIIPAYNVGSYILQTVNSVLSQDYPQGKLEIIVVNDGSTDNTADVLQSIVSNNIVVVTKDNGGVSSARNKGLDIAKGKYISFLDGDDTWESNFLIEMIEYINKNELKSAGCLYNRVLEFGKENVLIDLPKVIDKYNLLFTDGCDFGEDTEFFGKVIIESGENNFWVLNKYLTNYHLREGSLTEPGKVMRIRRKIMYFEAFRRTITFMEAKKVQETIIKQFKQRFYSTYISYLSSTLLKDRKTNYRILKKMFETDLKNNIIISDAFLDNKEQLRYYLIKFDMLTIILKPLFR